jgi:hypothetical protein
MYFSAYKNKRCDYLLAEACGVDITETSNSAIVDLRIEKCPYLCKIAH